MPVRAAIMMSAVFNFLGVFVMTQINSSVASTISNMVDFGEHTNEALIALCAALLSIVVYSTAASFFGIPTSESHSLNAGLSGGRDFGADTVTGQHCNFKIHCFLYYAVYSLYVCPLGKNR